MRAAASKVVVHSQQSSSDTFSNYYFKFYKMTIGPKLNGTTKPLDLSLIKQKHGTWKKIKLLLGQVDAARMPVRTSRELKTLDAHQLRDLLAKERVALTTNKRSTIVFIDCQHEKSE
jgi:hypothetical protein